MYLFLFLSVKLDKGFELIVYIGPYMSCHLIETFIFIMSCHLVETFIFIMSCHLVETFIFIMSCHLIETYTFIMSCHLVETYTFIMNQIWKVIKLHNVSGTRFIKVYIKMPTNVRFLLPLNIAGHSFHKFLDCHN